MISGLFAQQLYLLKHISCIFHHNGKVPSAIGPVRCGPHPSLSWTNPLCILAAPLACPSCRMALSTMSHDGDLPPKTHKRNHDKYFIFALPANWLHLASNLWDGFPRQCSHYRWRPPQLSRSCCHLALSSGKPLLQQPPIQVMSSGVSKIKRSCLIEPALSAITSLIRIILQHFVT